MEYYVVTFNTITDALTAEKFVSGLGGIIIPVPPEISAGCGFALRILELKPAMEILKNEAKYDDVYGISVKGNTKIIKKLFNYVGDY